MRFVEEMYTKPILDKLEKTLGDHDIDHPRRKLLNRLRIYLSCYRLLVEAEFDSKSNVLEIIVEAERRALA